MNEFEFGIGERVGIIAGVFHGYKGTILSKESLWANGTPIRNKYNVEVIVEKFGERHIIAKDKNDLVTEKIFDLVNHFSKYVRDNEINPCGADCNCCNCDECNDSDYENNKVAESLGNDKKFDCGDLASKPTCPEIREYYYDPWTGTTVLKWTDGTTTKVRANKDDTPDQHAGFAYAVAKKFFGNGNGAMKEAKWWIEDEPKIREQEEEFCKEYDAEQARKEAKRKADREKRIIKAKALERKREYEARKLAAEKYDVPMEWRGTNE